MNGIQTLIRRSIGLQDAEVDYVVPVQYADPDHAAMLAGEWSFASGSSPIATVPSFISGSPIPYGPFPLVRVEDEPRSRTNLDDMLDALMDRMYGQHCGKAVVKCQHCGQWAARFCACKQCGASVD